MGPQDGRTDFMFCYYSLKTLSTTSGLVASSFLAFLSDFVFLVFFVFLVAIWFLFSVRAVLTTTRDHIFNESETHRGLVRHLDFRIIKADEGLGSFELLGLLERLRILGLFRVFGRHLVDLSV